MINSDEMELSISSNHADIMQKIFSALSRRRFYDLLSVEAKNLSPILPCLCRMILLPTGLTALLSIDEITKLRAFLLDSPRTNTLVTFMSVDFPVLETDLRKEVKLRKKNSHASTNGNGLESWLSSPSAPGIGQRFEGGDPAEKYRILLSELLTTQLLLNENKDRPNQQSQPSTSKSRSGPSTDHVNCLKRFEPLDNEAYVGDCSDLLVIFLAERPSVISIQDLCETLTCYRNGPSVIGALVLNFPDSWFKVCYHLIDGVIGTDDRTPMMQKRLETLTALCELDNLKAIDLVNHCVEKKKLRIAAYLAVRFLPAESVAPLISGALATADDQQRPALVAFVNASQKDWPVLRDVNVPKAAKKSATQKADTSRASAAAPERAQFSEMDEVMFDILGRNLEPIVDLKSLRDLWEHGAAIETTGRPIRRVTPSDLRNALMSADQRPSAAILALRSILQSHRGVQIDYIEALAVSMPALLEPSVRLRVIQLACRLWSKIELLAPRKLYVLTVASLLPETTSRFTSLDQRTTHLDLCKDPLTILRCDERIFRCAPILALLLRILQCYLAASRAYLQRELVQASTTPSATSTSGRRLPAAPTPAQVNAEAEREELMRSLIGAQESAAVQILLEACLPMPSEQEIRSNLTALREIRCVICSFIHQLFIHDPILGKLVHFQTYPSELLPVTVAGIPSMHICLDFVAEMLAQPIQSKRIFAIDLLSHLCVHYAIPRAFGIARLALNALSTLVGVVPGNEIVSMFAGLLPAMMRINRIFPPLSQDIASLLVQVGRICRARLAANDSVASASIGFEPWTNLRARTFTNRKEAILLSEIIQIFRTTFADASLAYPL